MKDKLLGIEPNAGQLVMTTSSQPMSHTNAPFIFPLCTSNTKLYEHCNEQKVSLFSSKKLVSLESDEITNNLSH